VASSYKLKLILGGPSGSGKTTFLHGTPIFDSPIGVSFKNVECLVNEGDSFNFMVWDLKASKRFEFLYKNFCRGAFGAIICFDTTNYDSFKSLESWIYLVRDSLGDIPIFLIGTKIDLNKMSIPYDEIEDFIKEYNINGLFFATSYDSNLKRKVKEAIFKRFIQKIEPDKSINEFEIINPQDDDQCLRFIEQFLKCPICQADNHKDSLTNFYYSRDPSAIKLREKLFQLIDEDFTSIFYNPITIGIPCCKCYKELFK